MFKLKKLYKKKSQSKTGFSLTEVLVAMLIAFFFVLGSMQALVLATAFRVKAQEKQRANQLIQEDIEQINLAAKDLAVDQRRCGVVDFNGDGTVDYDDGYAKALWDSLPGIPSDKQLLGNEGKTYRLSRQADTTTEPEKVLKINYEVKEWDGSALVGNAIATDYIEVIPNAAVQCPK